jgi:hypothetical protein
MNQVGLWLVKTETITSGTSTTITDVFNSEYKNYRIVISDCRFSGANNVFLRMGTTATGYYNSGISVGYSTGTVTGVPGSNVTYIEMGAIGGTADTAAAVVDVQSPQIAQRTTFQWMGTDGRAGGGGCRVGNGFLNNTTVYTSITVLTNSAVTFSNCVVSVYGYNF